MIAAKPGLLAACDQLRDTAQTAHKEVLALMSRVRALEQEIASLKAEYGPQGTEPTC